MNNKYDVSLTDDEKKQLKENANAIVDYLKGLVADFGTSAKLNAEWSFYDNVWGNRTCEIEIKKDFRYKGVYGDSEKEWYTKVNGRVGKRWFDFEKEEKLDQEYALSLLDNWVAIKSTLNNQVEQRSATRNLIKEFKL